MREKPSVSVIIVALNCAQNIAECLKRIKEQDYPADRVEILVIDGGSTDGTQEVAESFGATVYSPGYKDNCEPRRAIGLLESKNDIVCYIESDIFLPTPQWLVEMISPLVENPEIAATQSLRYEYRKEDNTLNRYFALLGIHDPIAYYLKKRDKLSWADKKWTLFGDAHDLGAYYAVTFDINALPPLGCNGFVARREELLRLTLPDIEKVPLYTHSDSVYDMVAAGRNKIGFVKNTVIHVPSNDTVWKYLRRRMFYTRNLHFGGFERKYKVYDPKNLRDDLNLLKYIVYSLTVVKPVFDSLRGFIRKPDAAWFVHPIMCLMMFFSYSFVTIRQMVTVSPSGGSR